MSKSVLESILEQQSNPLGTVPCEIRVDNGFKPSANSKQVNL